MKTFLGVLFSGIILFSCSQKQDIKFYWVRFHGHEYKKADTIPIIKFEKSQNSDATKCDYTTKYDKLSYFIIKNSDSSFLISNPKDSLIHPNDKVAFMRKFYDTSIIFKQDTFKITKFILDEFVTDGASIHYYTPSLGIYAGHSETWPRIKYLQSSDNAINSQINYLIKATVPKFFIRDTLEQIIFNNKE